MFKLDPIKLGLVCVCLGILGYVWYIHNKNQNLKRLVDEKNTELIIERNNAASRLFSQKELIKLKEKEKSHEDLNLSVGIHTLKL